MTDGSVSLERPTETSILLRRSFAASPALIWRLWTDPSHLARWFGPRSARCGQVVSDLRIGGAWRVEMLFDGGVSRVVGGEYREIVAERRLAATWRWLKTPDGQSPESLYALDLQADGDSTIVNLSHQLWSDEAAAAHAGGWTSSFDSLADALQAG